MFAFLSKMFSNIYLIFTSPYKLLNWSYNFYKVLLKSVSEFFRHFSIIREANISLGKYHIQNKNFRDAIFRFWITDKLFAPNDKENLYWYAWAEIFSNKYAKALHKLEDNKFDEVGLKDYIQNLSTTTTIPKRIYDEYIALSEKFFLERYFDKKADASIDFLKACLENIPKEWNANRDYKVLEFFTNPIIISEIFNMLPENNRIDGVNYSENIHDISKEYNKESRVYSSLKKLDTFDISSLKPSYDLILCFDSFSFTLDLERYFSHLKKLLEKNGKIVILLPKGQITKLQPSLNCFIYDEEFIKKKIKLADLELMSIKSIKVNKHYEYFTIVAK